MFSPRVSGFPRESFAFITFAIVEGVGHSARVSISIVHQIDISKRCTVCRIEYTTNAMHEHSMFGRRFLQTSN